MTNNSGTTVSVTGFTTGSSTSLSVSSTTMTNGVNNGVLFQSGSTLYNTPNLIYNEANKALVIGTSVSNTATLTLKPSGGTATAVALRIRKNTDDNDLFRFGGDGILRIFDGNGNDVIDLNPYNSNGYRSMYSNFGGLEFGQIGGSGIFRILTTSIAYVNTNTLVTPITTNFGNYQTNFVINGNSNYGSNLILGGASTTIGDSYQNVNGTIAMVKSVAPTTNISNGAWIYSGSGATSTDVGIGIRTASGTTHMLANNVGFNTTQPASTLHVSGSVSTAIVNKTSSYTATTNDYTIIMSGSSLTLTLPAASGVLGRIYIIVNIYGGSLTISSYNDFTSTAQTTISSNSSITIQSNGTIWQRII